MRLVRSTLRALAFLGRFPAAGFAFTAHHPLGGDAPAFPLAGLAIACFPASLLLLAGALGLSPLVCATLAVSLTIALTGALHEDGLADVADGLGGHSPRERALAIMKDSRIGAYGTLALIASVGLRVSLTAEIAAAAPVLGACALLGAASASRGAMALFWAVLPSAAQGGVADSAGRPARTGGLKAALLGGGIALGLGTLGGWLGGAPLAGLFGALLGLAISAGALLLFARMLMRRLGGQTGDCLGAAQQFSEIALLLGIAIPSA